MKKNGFTLVELIVSIVIISFIGILFFYMIISFKNKLSEVNLKSEILTYNATVMKIVYDDMINHKIIAVTNEGNNTIAYRFSIDGENVDKKLSFSDNYISYNNVNYPTPNNCKITESKYSNLLDDEKTTNYNNVFSLNLVLDCHVLNEKYNINFTSIY